MAAEPYPEIRRRPRVIAMAVIWAVTQVEYAGTHGTGAIERSITGRGA